MIFEIGDLVELDRDAPMNKDWPREWPRLMDCFGSTNGPFIVRRLEGDCIHVENPDGSTFPKGSHIYGGWRTKRFKKVCPFKLAALEILDETTEV